MYFTIFSYQKSDGTYDRNIFAYDTYEEAVSKQVDIKYKFRSISSKYFQCSIFDDEGRCINNNLEE